MSTRNLMPVEPGSETVERLAKPVRCGNISEAARIGFADLEEGRFVDVANGNLEEFIAGLGRKAEAGLQEVVS